MKTRLKVSYKKFWKKFFTCLLFTCDLLSHTFNSLLGPSSWHSNTDCFPHFTLPVRNASLVSKRFHFLHPVTPLGQTLFRCLFELCLHIFGAYMQGRQSFLRGRRSVVQTHFCERTSHLLCSPPSSFPHYCRKHRTDNLKK